MDADQTSKLIIYYVKVYLMVEYHHKADHKDLSHQKRGIRGHHGAVWVYITITISATAVFVTLE